MAGRPGSRGNRGDAGTTCGPHETPTVDTFFIAFTIALFLLVVAGIAAIELGIDTRPGFDGSPDR
jgi:hypothetical protein